MDLVKTSLIGKTLLKNQESRVINGGKTTKYFQVKQGQSD